jgi:hypothetical protein
LGGSGLSEVEIMLDSVAKDILQAGTGFMNCLTEELHRLEEAGYKENLSAKFDHFEARSGEIKLNPSEIIVDDHIRFENTSDPDDQSIAYAIRDPNTGIKGVYVESYGLYHDELSHQMIELLKTVASPES